MVKTSLLEIEKDYGSGLLLVISEQYHLKPSWVNLGERSLVMVIIGGDKRRNSSLEVL